MEWINNPSLINGVLTYTCAQYMSDDESVCVHKHKKYAKKCISCEHTHDFFEFAYVIVGNGSNDSDGVSETLGSGSFLYVLPGECHNIRVADSLLPNLRQP